LTEHRTKGILVLVNTEALLVDALAQVGVQARATAGPPDQGTDLVLDPGGVEVQVKHRSLVTGEVARRLLRETLLPPHHVLLVVADRVTEDARAVLIGQHAGYFDLRGHLAMRSATIVIDVDVEPVSGRSERTNALNGTVGLEVATALLMNPAEGAAVRELARRLGRSASTVSEILAALRSAGLVDERHRVEGTELFWQAAERWPAVRVDLARLPMPGDATLTRSLRLGLDDAEQTTGWALTDSAAAAAYGAPLAVSTGQLLDFYVPDQATARRATTLLGAAPSRAQARCAIQIAPVRSACSHRLELANNPFEWPLAHPVFVALDLAQDAGRGREVLADWTPPERWTRVW
jgi:DNA-binding transcriptional ArsR family regulator